MLLARAAQARVRPAAPATSPAGPTPTLPGDLGSDTATGAEANASGTGSLNVASGFQTNASGNGGVDGATGRLANASGT